MIALLNGLGTSKLTGFIHVTIITEYTVAKSPKYINLFPKNKYNLTV